MSYLNLITIEVGSGNASVASASAPVKVTQPPSLIWANLNFPGFVGCASMALTVFGGLAWMFVYC